MLLTSHLSFVTYNAALALSRRWKNRRHSQLHVRLVPSEKNCWVALPPAHVARLLDAQSAIPLVLQLPRRARCHLMFPAHTCHAYSLLNC